MQIRETGMGADDLAAIALTHIHADHAGGAGALAKAFPKATIYVHPKGARHLIDPSRLEASVRALYLDAYDELMGALTPIDAGRVQSVSDGERIDLGEGEFLEVLETPGHAKHHLTFIDAEGSAYTGDAVGIGIGRGPIQPATPPSDFDLGLALASIAKIREADPTQLMFAHFGRRLDVDETFDQAERGLIEWVEAVKAAKASGLSAEEAITRLDANAPKAAAPGASVMGTRTNVYGVWQYLDQANEMGK
jgi:glyoxylase-like metal-dependent hydrolase (beta-lactamase superfamily II)